MGASDGTVLSITKILDNGSNASRHNIVLVAEGFTHDEQGTFEDLCDQFLDTLEAETWFSELSQAINVFRLNVESDESGADVPALCEDGEEGAGTSVNTYFDASFCNSGVWRCLSGDYELVMDTLDDQLPEWKTAAVLVNANDRGGCANKNLHVSWTSVASEDWRDVVLHEIGHASFKLADEYNTWRGCDSGEIDRDHAPAGEPIERNVTRETDRDEIKWAYFIEPATPVPTMENPDCSECDERGNVLDDDTIIGLYEGAKYYHCDLFRPAYICRMRNSSQPFCRVCIDDIADVLADFIDDQPTVEVVPSLVEFGDVAHGLTTYRAIEIRNVKVTAPVGVDIELSIISGDDSFSYAPDTPLRFRLPAPVFESYTSKTIFVAFTSAEDGAPDAFGSLTVDTPDSAINLPLTVDLTARAIEPPPVDSVLVIDRSGSMGDETGIPGELKTDHALYAAQLYVSLLKSNDHIGIVRYNHRARDPDDILLDMVIANDAGKDLANGALTPANLEPHGTTSIGGGIILGSSVLDNGVADSRALVVLTDGRQNTEPDIPEATTIVQTKLPAQRVFAVGLGLNQLEDRLNQIASMTNGVAQITGDLVDQKEFLLQKLYVQILSDVNDEAFVRDPKQIALPGERKSTSIYLGEVDVSADFIVVFRKHPMFPKYLRVSLEAPDGTLISEDDLVMLPNVALVVAENHLYFRVKFPVFPDQPTAHIGRWKVWVENRTRRLATVAATHYSGGAPLYYSIMCKARSDFRLDGRVEQFDYRPGNPMQIILEPTLYCQPVELLEPVEVEVSRPNGYRQRLRLERSESGDYRTEYTDTGQVGSYLFATEVAARTPKNVRITRHRVMTGIIFFPGATGDSTRVDQGDRAAKKCCKEILTRLDRIVQIMEERSDR